MQTFPHKHDVFSNLPQLLMTEREISPLSSKLLGLLLSAKFLLSRWGGKSLECHRWGTGPVVLFGMSLYNRHESEGARGPFGSLLYDARLLHNRALHAGLTPHGLRAGMRHSTKPACLRFLARKWPALSWNCSEDVSSFGHSQFLARFAFRFSTNLKKTSHQR